MDISIVGRHAKVTDELRERITSRMAKLAELAPRASRVEVHVVHERNPRFAADSERIEITLHDRVVIRTEASADDRLAALELATTRMVERLRKLHDKHAHRHQDKAPLHAVTRGDVLGAVPLGGAEEPPADVPVENVEPWEGAPEAAVREIGLDGTPITIRSKVHSAAPMSVAEAIDQMELVGHDFFLFHDEESGMPSAVYRRRGWTYGVIHLDSSEESAQRASA